LCAALQPTPGFAQQTWQYTVERGDTLIGIARRHLTAQSHWHEIQRLNRVPNPHRLVPGSTLLLPLPITRVEPASARLVTVSGGVDLLRNGAKLPASSGQALQPGDEIVSGADGTASVEFADGSQARVLGGSHVKLSQMLRLGQSKIFNTEIELKQGRIESSVKQKPRGAQNYMIRTPTVNLGVRGTEFRAALESSDASRTEVLQGLVNAANPAGQVGVAAGFGTVAKLNAPPEKPRKLLPAADLSALGKSVAERLPFTISWPAVSGAQSYRVQVARDATFAAIVSDILSDKNEAKLSSDIEDGHFAVRVRAIDALRLEGQDAIGELHINARPLPPLTEFPSNKSIVRGDAAEFRWAQTKDASGYRLQVSSAPDFSKIVLDSGARQESNMTAPLAPGEYFWRVASVGAGEDQGPFGQVSKFALKPMPAFQGPAVDNRSFTLEWSAGEPGQQFHVQLARNADFNPIALDRRLIESRLELPRPVGGEFFVRISVTEADGSAGEFGPVQRFKVPPHELPITYSLSAHLLNLRWPAVLQPGWKYQWQLARDAAFVDIVRDDVIESSIPSIARMPEGGTFYARTRVIDDQGQAGEYYAATRIDMPGLRAE
jgi:hypothetical protein